MIRWIALGLAAVVVMLGVAAYRTDPPVLLSLLDGVTGGGRGTRRMGTGIAFGTHGQRLDVWRPASRVGEPRPVVIFYYGGGWVAGTRQGYAFAARAYASQGFVVVVPDYRKVPGVRFPAFLRDAADAVRWTRDHVGEFGGDRDRIAVVGHSAGAYAAAMLALDRRWTDAAGVPRTTIKAAVGLSGPYDFYPHTGRAVAAMQGASRRETQPIAFARADTPPMLLVTSSADSVVRPKNARNLALALRRLGAQVHYRNYTGLRHQDTAMALSKPFRGKAPVLHDSVAFLQSVMR